MSGANLAQLLVIGAAMGFQVIVTLYMQRALGYRPAQAGLGMVPMAAAVIAAEVARPVGTADRAVRPATVAACRARHLITAALALLTQLPAHAGYATRLLPPLVLFGLGAGLTLPAVTTLGMAGATDADAGVISGVFNTTQQAGGALGVAVLTALAAARTGGGTSAQALTSGYQLAFAATAAVASCAASDRRSVAVMLRPQRAAGGARPDPSARRGGSRRRRQAGPTARGPSARDAGAAGQSVEGARWATCVPPLSWAIKRGNVHHSRA